MAQESIYAHIKGKIRHLETILRQTKHFTLHDISDSFLSCDLNIILHEMSLDHMHNGSDKIPFSRLLKISNIIAQCKTSLTSENLHF